MKLIVAFLICVFVAAQAMDTDLDMVLFSDLGHHSSLLTEDLSRLFANGHDGRRKWTRRRKRNKRKVNEIEVLIVCH